MQTIEERARSPKNIIILKAAEFYCRKARTGANLRKAIAIMPILAAAIGTIICCAVKSARGGFVLNVLAAVIPILSVAADAFLRQRIAKNREKEYILRDEYNHRVLGIRKSRMYEEGTDTITKNLEGVAYFLPHRSRYEKWFGTKFSDNEFGDAMCLLMEKPVYYAHAYRMYRERLLNGMLAELCACLVYVIWYAVVGGDRLGMYVNPAMLFISMAFGLNMLAAEVSKAEELENTAKGLVRYAEANAEDLNGNKEDRGMALRMISDAVLCRRPDMLFVPEQIRKRCMMENSKYMRDMKKLRSLYHSEQGMHAMKEAGYRLECL